MNALEVFVNRNKGRKLMKQVGISVRQCKKCKITTKSRSLTVCWSGILQWLTVATWSMVLSRSGSVNGKLFLSL